MVENNECGIQGTNTKVYKFRENQHMNQWNALFLLHFFFLLVILYLCFEIKIFYIVIC